MRIIAYTYPTRLDNGIDVDYWDEDPDSEPCAMVSTFNGHHTMPVALDAEQALAAAAALTDVAHQIEAAIEAKL